MKMNCYPKFSVAMSLYGKEKPEYLEDSLQSICEQSIAADEIFLVIDGPITGSLDAVVKKYSEKYGNFTIFRLEQNQGLGNALAIAMREARNDLIFRMDTDDISAPGRFKKQLDSYIKDPVDVLGCSTLGFSGDLNKGEISMAVKKLTNEEIQNQLASRSPMSHVTVLLNRKAVLRAGNYQSLHYHEDYYLWARMIKNSCSLRNIPDFLVYVRTGGEQARRHGGWKYFSAEMLLRNFMLKNKLISVPKYTIEVFKRIIYQLLLTPSMRNYVSMHLNRKNITRSMADEIIKRNIEDDKKI